jgi:hypothetical protein
MQFSFFAVCEVRSCVLAVIAVLKVLMLAPIASVHGQAVWGITKASTPSLGAEHMEAGQFSLKVSGAVCAPFASKY